MSDFLAFWLKGFFAPYAAAAYAVFALRLWTQRVSRKEWLVLACYIGPTANQVAQRCGGDATMKDSKYRSLLHDIKMAWLDFDDGPNQLVLQRIFNYREDGNVQIIFNNCREPEQLAYWDKLLTDAGIHHFSLAINNHNIKWDLTNLADRTTDNYIYTFYFTNDGTIEKHQQQGEMMRDAIVGAYKDVYGEDIFNH